MKPRLFGMNPARFGAALAANLTVIRVIIAPSNFICKTRGKMKRIVCLLLIASLAACSVCKSTDSPEVCRTKERDHGKTVP
jgi:hypothetical protein